MPHDPVRVADTRGWLAKAKNDLRGAEIDQAADPPLPEDALFHCQQAVEKTLKGFLAWHDRPFRKTHDLVELGEECVRIESSLEPLLRRAASLTEYAWVYRYPGDAESPASADVVEALVLAGEVYRAVLAQLPPDAHPRG